MALPQYDPLTVTEYLALDRDSDLRNEYISGEIIAMAGASRVHSLIAGNTYASVHTQLRGKSCEVHQNDMRVTTSERAFFAYPDLVVACGDVQLAEGIFDTLINPALVIEVLSKSTERNDRGDKFMRYRAIATLQDYLLVSQNAARIEHYRRAEDDTWVLTDYVGLDAVLDLPSIGCKLSLADAYERVDFTVPNPEADGGGQDDAANADCGPSGLDGRGGPGRRHRVRAVDPVPGDP